jgi:hypothetical protein
MKKKRSLALRMVIIIAGLSIFCGCSPSSLEDFHCEGESRCKALIEELQKIHNREQLTRAQPILKKYFEDLVTLMIRAREFQENHSDESETTALVSENTVSALLEKELRRIYAMEGGRESIETAQQEALVRLDAFERACARKRQAIR